MPRITRSQSSRGRSLQRARQSASAPYPTSEDTDEPSFTAKASAQASYNWEASNDPSWADPSQPGFNFEATAQPWENDEPIPMWNGQGGEIEHAEQDNEEESDDPNVPPLPDSPFHPPNATGPGSCTANQVFPRMDLLVPGEPVAFDAEFQIFKPTAELNNPEYRWRQRLGWAAAVNTKGETILDCHVRYRIPHGETPAIPSGYGVSGQSIMLANGAVPARYAEKWFMDIFRGRTVILHGGQADRTAFRIEDAFGAAKEVRDTQRIYGGQMGLGNLFRREIPDHPFNSTDWHSPVKDAQGTMMLYVKRFPWNRANKKAALRGRNEAQTCVAWEGLDREVAAVREQQRTAPTGRGGRGRGPFLGPRGPRGSGPNLGRGGAPASGSGGQTQGNVRGQGRGNSRGARGPRGRGRGC